MSYLDIVNQFRTICQEHLAINGFGEGSIKLLDTTSQNIEYPYCYLRPLESDGLVTNEDGYGSFRRLSFELYVLDIPKISDEDSTKLMSNCEQYCYDIMAYFNFNSNVSFNYVCTMKKITPLYEAFVDRTVGWVVEFDIVTPFIQDYCNFPKL